MQNFLQKGLAVGMSVTSGIHSNKLNLLPKGFDLGRDLTPPTFVPKPFSGSKVTYRGQKHNVEASRLINESKERPAVKEVWKILVSKRINHIDTAQVYGDGETERVCAELAAGMEREDFVMQTELVESLERMNLDYMDVDEVHGPIHPQSISKVAKSLVDCVDQRLTKTVACANYLEDDMLELQRELGKYGIPLTANQYEYSLLRREDEIAGLLQTYKATGIVFQSYLSLAQGHLSGKYNSQYEPPEDCKFSSYPMKEIEPTLAVKRRIADNHGVSVAALALNYNLVHGIVPLVGIRNPEQATQNAQALGWRLSDDEIRDLDIVSYKGKRTKLWQQG